MTDFRTATTDQIEDTSRRLGSLGEILIDTTKKTIVLEDGSQSGVPLAREDLVGTNFSKKTFTWLEDKKPVIPAASLGNLHSTGVRIDAEGELILRVPGIYFDITVPFATLRAQTRGGSHNDAVIATGDRKNAIKVADINNIEVYVGIGSGYEILISVMKKPSIPGIDLSRQTGIYFREIRIRDLPDNSRSLSNLSPTQGDIAYFNGTDWVAGVIDVKLVPITVSYGTGLTGDLHTKLRTTGLNIGAVGEGEIIMGFEDEGIKSILYSELRSLAPTNAANNNDALTNVNARKYTVSETDDVKLGIKIIRDVDNAIVNYEILALATAGSGAADRTSELVFYERRGFGAAR